MVKASERATGRAKTRSKSKTKAAPKGSSKPSDKPAKADPKKGEENSKKSTDGTPRNYTMSESSLKLLEKIEEKEGIKPSAAVNAAVLLLAESCGISGSKTITLKSVSDKCNRLKALNDLLVKAHFGDRLDAKQIDGICSLVKTSEQKEIDVLGEKFFTKINEKLDDVFNCIEELHVFMSAYCGIRVK